MRKSFGLDISPRMINLTVCFIPLFLGENFLRDHMHTEGCKPTTIKVMGEATLVDRHYNKFQDSREQMEGH